MPGNHLFPTIDADFNSYTDTTIPYLITNAKRLGISEANVTLIKGLQGSWDANWTMFKDPMQHTSIVTKTKTDLRHQIEVAMRTVFGDIPQSALTATDRTVLNVKERDTHGSRVGVMNHAPTVVIDETIHLQHTLRFADPESPDSNAMPNGQMIVLQSFVGKAGLAADAIAFNNSQNVTRFLATVGFTDAQVGQTCYYRCCYESTHGEQGPWSTTLNGVVA